MHRFTLEKYRGSRTRFTCPRCGKNELVRYVDTETGAHLAAEVGRCNRESSCGYHLRPREYFAANPQAADAPPISRRKSVKPTPKPRDFITPEILKQTLYNFERNAFISFLIARFSSEKVCEVVRTYFIGTWTDARTVFWQIDGRGRIRTAKLIAYDAATGKRIKSLAPSWAHAELKRAKKLREDFTLRQCLFGEHLLTSDCRKPVAVVEAEKTAIIASLYFPRFAWLATGGSCNLNVSRVLTLAHRKVVLFPDSSKFEQWQRIAADVRRETNLEIEVSDFLETRLTAEEKQQDLDLADVLLRTNINAVSAASSDCVSLDDVVTDEMIEYSAHLEYYGASREDADQTARRMFQDVPF